MGALPRSLLRHTVTIEAYAGTDGYGVERYSAAVTVRCFAEDRRRLVRAATGDEVVSEATLIAPLATAAPVQSRVTLPDGRIATVINALHRDGGGLPTPDHLEIILT